MDAPSSIALAVSVIIAASVPWWTFKLALRQDRDRRLHEQRSALYVDLLTEAYAEHKWFEFESADPETRDRMKSYFVDLRLPPMERARLGARATGFASSDVNQLFNKLQGAALATTLLGTRDEASLLMGRVKVGEALSELEQAIRRDLA